MRQEPKGNDDRQKDACRDDPHLKHLFPIERKSSQNCHSPRKQRTFFFHEKGSRRYQREPNQHNKHRSFESLYTCCRVVDAVSLSETVTTYAVRVKNEEPPGFFTLLFLSLLFLLPKDC